MSVSVWVAASIAQVLIKPIYGPTLGAISVKRHSGVKGNGTNPTNRRSISCAPAAMKQLALEMNMFQHPLLQGSLLLPATSLRTSRVRRAKDARSARTPFGEHGRSFPRR